MTEQPNIFVCVQSSVLIHCWSICEHDCHSAIFTPPYPHEPVNPTLVRSAAPSQKDNWSGKLLGSDDEKKV